MANADGGGLSVQEAICIAVDDVGRTISIFPKDIRIRVKESDENYVVSIFPESRTTKGGDLNITIDKKTKSIVRREVGQ